MKNKKPEVGQIVYSLPIGNAARGGRGIELTSMSVIKVGRKYFYAAAAGRESDRDSHMHVKVGFETWVEHSDWVCHKFYESTQEWEDEKTYQGLSDAFRRAFDWFGRDKFNLQDLKRAADILGIEVEE